MSRRWRPQPFAVSEATAAGMLELRIEEFRRWARDVDLQPCYLAGQERYVVDEMKALLRGESKDGLEW